MLGCQSTSLWHHNVELYNQVTVTHWIFEKRHSQSSDYLFLLIWNYFTLL
jgi:hypothetical protein